MAPHHKATTRQNARVTPPRRRPRKKKSRVGKILLVFFGGTLGLIMIANMSEPSTPAETAEVSDLDPQPAATTSEPARSDKPENAILIPPFSIADVLADRSIWPRQITISTPLSIEENVTIPAGAPVDFIDLNNQGIVTVRVMDKLYQLEYTETDLEERALDKRADQEQLAVEEQQKLTQFIGPEPRRDSWSGGTVAVQHYLKANLKDPNSLQYLGWTNPRVSKIDGEPYWHVRVRYRAKNSFGGYVIESQDFYLRNNTVLRVD